jgi:hypothetical protein
MQESSNCSSFLVVVTLVVFGFPKDSYSDKGSAVLALSTAMCCYCMCGENESSLNFINKSQPFCGPNPMTFALLFLLGIKGRIERSEVLKKCLSPTWNMVQVKSLLPGEEDFVLENSQNIFQSSLLFPMTKPGEHVSWFLVGFQESRAL